MTARLSLVLALVLASACNRAPGRPVSVAYVNAKVVTLTEDKAATGLRVTNGVVTEVLHGETLPLPGEQVVDLKGASLVPGLVDSHGHLDMLGWQMVELDLRGTRSADEVAQRVRERAGTVPAGGWIVGFGWDQNQWPGKQFPSRAVLDKAAPGHKVWLKRIAHADWVNSAVLEAAGIDAKTPSPQGGEIIHDPDGRPSGVLVDNAAKLATQLLPQPTLEERRTALTRGMEHVAKLGLTGVHSMMMTVADAEALRSLEAEGRVPIHVMVYITDEWPAVQAFIKKPPERTGMVWFTGVKLFADGALGSRSAALLAPYSDDQKAKGLTIYDTPALRERVVASVQAGYQVAIHAIGDAANHQALDVLAPLAKDSPYPPRIEHVQIISPDDITRFAATGIVASVQPIHAPSDMTWAIERVGWDRLKAFAYPAKTLIDQGALVVLGSDFPIESANPWLGIHAAVTRQNGQDEPPGGFLPEQALSLEQALRHYCVTPHQAVNDKMPGVLAPGAPADFVVVDLDPFAIAPAALRAVTVQRTVVAGREIYAAGKL